MAFPMTFTAAFVITALSLSAALPMAEAARPRGASSISAKSASSLPRVTRRTARASAVKSASKKSVANAKMDMTEYQTLKDIRATMNTVLKAMKKTDLRYLGIVLGAENEDVVRLGEILQQYTDSLERIPLPEVALQKPLEEYRIREIHEIVATVAPLPKEYETILKRLGCALGRGCAQ